jgi:LmbE family N-acetylglucosaminyl deacetylase
MNDRALSGKASATGNPKADDAHRTGGYGDPMPCETDRVAAPCFEALYGTLSVTRLARDVLARLEQLPLRDLEALQLRGLVVVAPHPDDESLGCGGLIAAARAQDIPVRIVVLSDGAASHPNSRAFPPERLRALREEEIKAAAAELGVAGEHVLCLRLPDGSVPRTGADASRAVAAIVDILKRIGANLMTVTWEHDWHVDHKAAFELARRASHQLPDIKLYAYPIWAFDLTGDETVSGALPEGFRLAIANELAAKRRAIACHRSQVTRLIDDDPQGFRLTPEQLARFDRPFEIFIEVTPGERERPAQYFLGE